MWNRRHLLLTGGAVLATAPTRAQPAPPLEQAALDVLPNLVTRMAVPVGVNRHPPVPFVVDTGANRTAISQELADQLRLPSGPEVLVNGVTAAVPTPTVRAESLFVAESHVRDLVLPVIPHSRLGVHGLLGVDVLGRFAVPSDVRASRLPLRRRGAALP